MQTIITYIIIGICAVLSTKFLSKKIIIKKDEEIKYDDKTGCTDCPLSEACKK